MDVLSNYHGDVEPLFGLWRLRDQPVGLGTLDELCREISSRIHIQPNPGDSPVAAWLLVGRDLATRIQASDDTVAWQLIHHWVDVPEDAFVDVPRAASTDWLDEVEMRIGNPVAHEPLKQPHWPEQIGWIRARCQEFLDNLPQQIKGPA